ncbi:Octapeptide-repeat protein T2, partial [Ophiophagus hannah]
KKEGRKGKRRKEREGKEGGEKREGGRKEGRKEWREGGRRGERRKEGRDRGREGGREEGREGILRVETPGLDQRRTKGDLRAVFQYLRGCHKGEGGPGLEDLQGPFYLCSITTKAEFAQNLVSLDGVESPLLSSLRAI